MTGPMMRTELSVFLQTRRTNAAFEAVMIDSNRGDDGGLTRWRVAAFSSLAHVMRDKDGHIPRELVPGGVGDFHLDGVNPSFPQAGAFCAQIDGQVAGDPPIRRGIAVAMTINGFAARDGYNLAADHAASVGRFHFDAGGNHLMIRR